MGYRQIYICDICGKEEESEGRAGNWWDFSLNRWSKPGMEGDFFSGSVLACPDCMGKVTIQLLLAKMEVAKEE